MPGGYKNMQAYNYIIGLFIFDSQDQLIRKFGSKLKGNVNYHNVFLIVHGCATAGIEFDGDNQLYKVCRCV